MKYFNSILVSLLVMTPAEAAWAQEACGETACEQGYVCERAYIDECAAIACAPDSDCDTACEPTAQEYCAPAPCTNDEQCGDGMVCHTTSYETCQGGTAPACESGADCGDVAADVAPEPSCVEHTVSQCTPTWQLPCTSDESCGEGFSCVERESCGCSGGGAQPAPAVDVAEPEPGSDAPDSSDGAPPPPREDCSCVPSGESHCVMDHIDCETDSQCPEGWLCQVSSSGTCWADSEGNTGCDESEERQCVPEAYDVVEDGRGELAAGSSNDTAVPTANGEGAGGEVPPMDGALEPASKPAAGGCSVVAGEHRTGATPASAWWALALGALGAVAGRRRGRRAA